jgi:hypothetical protein
MYHFHLIGKKERFIKVLFLEIEKLKDALGIEANVDYGCLESPLVESRLINDSRGRFSGRSGPQAPTKQQFFPQSSQLGQIQDFSRVILSVGTRKRPS